MSYWTYYPNYLSESEADDLYHNCINNLPFQQSQIRLFGRMIQIPRKECLIGTVKYGYSGNELNPQQWPEWLLPLKQKLEVDLDTQFNVCLVNLYTDGNDSNGWHADDEKDLGTNPTIASLSLGANRKFQIREKFKGSPIHSVQLDHGSLLHMKPGMQERFKHQLPKQKTQTKPRVNLTFRYVIH